MHYYKFNIADWMSATAHLTPVEESVYLRLINYYYDTERPIPLETQSVIRRLRLVSMEDVVDLVLEEYFTETDQGWVHDRCESILLEYRKMAKRNKKNAAKGGRPRQAKASGKPTGKRVASESDPDRIPNHKPETTNQEPDIHALFDRFWAAYPRKTSKQAAVKAFTKLKPDEDLVTLITDHIQRRVAAGDWIEKQYIPHASTFLNGQRWTDEIVPRGVPNGQYQQTPAPTRKPTPAERVREKQRAAAAATGPSPVDIVDPHVRDVRGDLVE